jgi:hypothetical protein
MSGRFKPYLLIITAILLATFFLNTPVACATKLAKACNVFDQYKVKKSGSCESLVPDKYQFDQGVGFPLIHDLEFSVSPGNLDNLFFLPDISSADFHSLPIRC